MLYKHGTAPAQGIHRFGANAGVSVSSDGVSVSTATVPTTAPVDPELLSLRTENARLQEELAELRQQWDDALTDAHTVARAEAAAEHVRNDERQYAAINRALAAAQAVFDQNLLQLEAIAPALAIAAMNRLVLLQQDEVEWLGRVIARRLKDLADSASVTIALSKADHAALDQLNLPGGTQIAVDAGLATGSARLDLRLGHIAISTGDGFRRIIAELQQETADG